MAKSICATCFFCVQTKYVFFLFFLYYIINGNMAHLFVISQFIIFHYATQNQRSITFEKLL